MKTRELTTYITAGKYKGKRLQLPSLSSTRSTKSILKESFFNTVQFDIVDAVFIEVFGGSGSMGLEAVSRGAKAAYFIEKDRDAYRVLKKNCEDIDKNKTYPFLGDSFDFFNILLDKIDEKAYFYFDPPFSIREGMDDIYEKVYNLIYSIPEEKAELIAIEHMSTKNMPERIGIFTIKKTKKFGKSSISYYGT